MAVAVNSETGYERQNLPEPTDCLWILQPSHVTRSHKNANVKRYAVATLPRTDGVIAHKWHTTRTGKPGRSAQTYFSFPSPAPLPNTHAHEEKLRLACETTLFVCLTLLASFFLPSHLSFKNMYIGVWGSVHIYSVCLVVCM